MLVTATLLWLFLTMTFIGSACLCTLVVLMLEIRNREYLNEHRRPAEIWMRCLKRVMLSASLPRVVVLLVGSLSGLRIGVCYLVHSPAARPDSEFMTFVFFPEQLLFLGAGGKFVFSTTFAFFLFAENVVVGLIIGLVLSGLRRAATFVKAELPSIENNVRAPCSLAAKSLKLAANRVLDC